MKGVVQQVWVDANGVSGRRSTRVTLCCTFPYAAPTGYMDPHGFVVLRGKHLDTSTENAAQTAMQSVVTALESAELAALDRIANPETMLEALKAFPTRPWFASFTELQNRWSRGDPELTATAVQIRKQLKLPAPTS